MNDTDQPQILSTRLYNSLLRGSKAQTYTDGESRPYADTPHLLNPAVIRQALADGSIYGWRNIGPKSVAQIKRWLTDQPQSQPTEDKITSDPTISDIIASLTRRGFLQNPNFYNIQTIQTQVDAVIEELGEVARILRRHRQARQTLDPDQLAKETCDVVIAAVCLLATTAGHNAPECLADKLAADETRGWLHSGLTREQYEHRSQA